MKVKVNTQSGDIMTVKNVIGFDAVGKSLHLNTVTGLKPISNVLNFTVYDMDEDVDFRNVSAFGRRRFMRGRNG